MSHKEVSEGNKLIAEFMGGEFETNLPFTYTKSGWVNTPANSSRQIAQDYDLKYHSDFNWLMPVVEKIEKLKFEIHIYSHYNWKEPNRVVICDWRDNIIINNSSDHKIEGLFKSIIEFIKWYNIKQSCSKN